MRKPFVTPKLQSGPTLVELTLQGVTSNIIIGAPCEPGNANYPNCLELPIQ